MTKIEDSLSTASLLIENKESKKIRNLRIYEAQTENSGLLFPLLTRRWEKSLWIGGSGQQAINGILFGSRDVTIIDKNPLALLFTEFNIASIEALTREEYRQFFYQNLYENGLPIIRQTKPFLQQETYFFWENLFNNYPKSEIMNGLFIENFADIENSCLEKIILNKNPYLNPKFFNYLKRVMQKTNILYQETDLLNVNLSREKPFDKVYLSNVFQELPLTLEEYQEFLEENIFPFVSEKGDVMAGYLNISKYFGTIRNNHGDEQEIIQFFEKNGYHSHLIFESFNQKELSAAFVYQKNRH